MTHLLALATAPQLQTTTVRHVEVLLLQPQVVVVVIITSTGGVTKRLFVFDEPVDPGLADWAAAYLKETVAGLRLGARLLRTRLEDSDPLRTRAVISSRCSSRPSRSSSRAATRGVRGRRRRARRRAPSGGHHDVPWPARDARAAAVLLDLLRFALEAKRPFVRVGSEFADPAFAKLALVAAPYGLSNRNLGTVSLLGPARMDYGKAIDAVRSAAGQLSRFVEELYEE